MLLLVAIVSGCGISSPPTVPSGASEPPLTASSTPDAAERRQHVFLIVFENKDYADVMTPVNAPYLTSLAAQYGLASNYSAVAHPSQPNYLALFSGSTHDVRDDKVHDLDGHTIADEVSAAGLSWRLYAENVPPQCYAGATAKDGPDGQGTYARKHNPAISFRSISTDPRACQNIMSFSQFDPGAANYSMIVPNLCHDMHDCSVAEGDAWLKGFLPRVLDSPAFTDGGVVFITFDEAKGHTEPNRVSTIVLSADGPRGATSNHAYDHYSLLRTIQDLLGLPCLANSCQAEPMTDLVSG